MELYARYLLSQLPNGNVDPALFEIKNEGDSLVLVKKEQITQVDNTVLERETRYEEVASLAEELAKVCSLDSTLFGKKASKDRNEILALIGQLVGMITNGE